MYFGMYDPDDPDLVFFGGGLFSKSHLFKFFMLSIYLYDIILIRSMIYPQHTYKKHSIHGHACQ